MRTRTGCWLVSVAAIFFLTGSGSEPQAQQNASIVRHAVFRPLVLEGSAVRWRGEMPRAGARVSFAFASRATVTPGARNCAEVTTVSRLLDTSGLEMRALREAFVTAAARWTRVADIEFYEASDESSADIIVGAQTRPLGRAFANVSLRGTAVGGVRDIARSVICLNPEHRWKIGFDGNLEVYDLVHTFTHEIGHAIGLDHPATSGFLMSPRYDEKIHDLTAGDVAGVVALYGPRRAHAASMRQTNGHSERPAR